MDIDSMSCDEWLAHHRQKVEEHFAKGLDLIPDPTCSTCDVHNDYVCFECELFQLRKDS